MDIWKELEAEGVNRHLLAEVRSFRDAHGVAEEVRGRIPNPRFVYYGKNVWEAAAAAVLCAVRLCPNVRGYLVPSHASFEIGYRLAMEAMDLRPLFDLGMRLGEGSGCPLAFQVLDAACAVINDMATFDEAGINDDYLDEIRRGGQFTP